MYAQDLRRTPQELRDVLRSADVLPQSHPVVQGARAALEWLVGDDPVSPITHLVLDPADAVLQEAVEAGAHALGIRATGPAAKYARGAEAVLMWAMDRAPLPDYLRASAA